MSCNHKFNIIIPPQDIRKNPKCLERIAAGDHKAFEWLYKNYGGKLYDYLYILSLDKELSEDVVQEVFVKLWLNREALVRITNINAYLYATAKNHLLNWQKKHTNEKLRLKELGKLTCSYTDTDTLIEKEKRVLVHRAINSLTPKQQIIYRLAREDGRKREEISKALKLSPFTVKCTIQNALKQLKEVLRREGMN